MSDITIKTNPASPADLLENPNRFGEIITPQRHLTTTVEVGGLKIGGGHPVVVQSMTNTDTADVESTAQQCFELWQAGSEIVRVTVNTEEAAKAVPYIRERLDALGCDVPLAGDFHYKFRLLYNDKKHHLDQEQYLNY